MAETSLEIHAEHSHRAVLNELAQLGKSDMPPDEFYSEFLKRVVESSGAVAAALWLREGGEAHALQLRSEVSFAASGLEAGTPPWERHAKLLVHVLVTKRGGIVAPRNGESETNVSAAANPTGFYLNICPITVHPECFGVVELVHPAELESEAQNPQIRFLHRACDFLVEYQRNLELRRMLARQKAWDRFDSFARQVHGSLQPLAVAYTIANEGRQFIGSDRASVALRRGGRTRIAAISGQDAVDSRANMVYGLARLADAVILAGERLCYSGGTDDLPPRIEKLLRAYLEQSDSKSILILPLREADQDPKRTPRPFGALIVEQFEDNSQLEPQLERAELVVRHSSMAWSNALRHRGVLLLPCVHWIEDRITALRGATLFRMLWVPALIATVGAVLAFVPADFRLEGKGKLLPDIRCSVFAGEDGIVREVLVKHGARVRTGDRLVELDNTDLAVQLQKAQADLLQARDEFHIESAQRGNKELTRSDEIQNSGKLMTLKGKIESHQREMVLLKTRIKRLTVRAPRDGVITTWDVERTLAARPVTRGNLLLNEADDRGTWSVEVQMPEDRIGHVLRARKNLETGERLPVEFILATQPEERYPGWVTEIGERTEFIDNANVVLVTVALDPTRLPPLRPGAEVRARIDCGEHALGYVWFHELIEFTYARVLFLM